MTGTPDRQDLYIPDPIPAGGVIERNFLKRVVGLEVTTRQAPGLWIDPSLPSMGNDYSDSKSWVGGLNAMNEGGKR